MSKTIYGDPLAEMGRQIVDRILKGSRDLETENIRPVRIELGPMHVTCIQAYCKTLMPPPPTEEHELIPGVPVEVEVHKELRYAGELYGLPIEQHENGHFTIIGFKSEPYPIIGSYVRRDLRV